MIHDSAFFASNFGISNLISLHGSSVYALVAAGATGACIGGVIAEVAAGGTGACIGGVIAEVASSWLRASRFANLCSILWRSCDCCTSSAVRLVSDCAFC